MNVATELLTSPPQGSQTFVEGLSGLDAVAEKILASLGQPQGAGGALEELAVHPLLKTFEGRTGCRSTQAEGTTGSTDAAQFGHPDEELHIGEMEHFQKQFDSSSNDRPILNQSRAI